MHARQGLREIAVPFIRDDHAATSFSNQKIGAGNAHVGDKELLPQLGPRFGEDIAALMEDAIRGQVGMRPPELLLPVLEVQVKGRRYDMARRLVPQLDDVFAEIGLDRLDTVSLQVLV